jgi:deoxyadenosine/deoxycytidine kinase
LLYPWAAVPRPVSRTSRRGRDLERSITTKYLQSLNDLHEEWDSNFVLCPVLTIPLDDLDYGDHLGHLNLIVVKAQEKLTGGQAVVFEDEEVTRASPG